MRVFAEINESEFKQTLRQWEKLTGKGIEDGIELLARSSASKLAHTVQPYGMSDGVGRKFIDNIGRQIAQVWFGINLGYYELEGTFENTYEKLRRQGRIRGRRFRDAGKRRWQWKVSEQDKERLIEKQQRKAGRAKAGWLAAATNINGKRVRGGGKWIQRHVKDGYGLARKTGSGLNAEFELHNRTPYLSSIQSGRDLATGLSRGRKAGLSSLNRAINAQLRKARQ